MSRSVCAVAAAWLALLILLPWPAGAQGVPGSDPNKCLAAKTKCVAKKAAGLFKCREKCQKNPARCGAAQAACEAKIMAKFDGGATPAKGCVAKVEAKANPSKPASVCTTTGDTADLETRVDAAVADLIAVLEGAPPAVCGNGTLEGTEACEFGDLDGETCASQGFFGGTLACTPGSCTFDTSGCNSCSGAGGAIVGGACWFLGAGNDSCDDVCGGIGVTYDTATDTYAGSNGTDANCQAVLDALSVTGSTVRFAGCGLGLGCGFDTGGSGRIRCSDATTSGAKFGTFLRACACMP